MSAVYKYAVMDRDSQDVDRNQWRQIESAVERDSNIARN